MKDLMVVYGGLMKEEEHDMSKLAASLYGIFWT
jgi:hypothetical protein